MRLVQYLALDGTRRVGVVSEDGAELQPLPGVRRVYWLALAAHRQGLPLLTLAQQFLAKSGGERDDYEAVVAAGRLLPPLDHPDPDVVLVRQYRYASGGELYEVPAGMPDAPDEPWEACAARELEEETGLRAGRLAPLTRIYTTPGFCDEIIRLYVASELTEGETNLDDDEFMEVVRVPFSQAVEMVRTGEIVDCKSVAAILYARCFVLGSSREES